MLILEHRITFFIHILIAAFNNCFRHSDTIVKEQSTESVLHRVLGSFEGLFEDALIVNGDVAFMTAPAS